MVDIVTRLGKGSPLTNAEVDANFTNLAEVSGVTGEPMGHEDRTTSTISFNASTRTFTITPVASSFTVWCKGKKVVVSTAQTVTIPNTTGMYSIYYDANGVLSAKSGYFTFSLEAPTAYVYWNATTGTAPYFGDERHGVVLDWQTHEYLHRTRGAALASGFSASGYVLGGNGSSNSHAQITLEGGTFFDEDMKIIVTATNTPTAGTWEQDLLSPARIPVLYLSGTGWVIDSPTDYPLKQGTARPQYNAYSGGVWSTADVANNKYATSWILATNNLTYPVIAIIGQAENDLQSAAEAVDFTALQLPGFPSVEFRPLYKLIFQCADSCTNAVHASLVSITDIRSIAAAGTAASIVTDHGNLSGLSDDDHPQYIHVDTLRTVSAAVKASFLPSQTSNAGKFLQTDGTATSWQALTSGNVTTALGFTPYNATNPSGYISGITSGMVTTALGFTPYNATNPSGYVTAAGARGAISVTGAGSYDSATGVINIVGGVTSFNTRTGAITLSSADVTTALGFTPYNNTNPSGYITGITSTMVTTALGFTPYNSSNPNGYISSITSANVTTALGFTPYNATNPSGYITSSALSGYLTSASAASTYLPLSGDATRSGTTTLSGVTIFNNYISLTGDFYHNGSQYILNAAQNGWINIVSRNGGNPFINNVTYNGNTILHAGNYNSYAPTLTGGGASGTWGISISGNAATATTSNTTKGVGLTDPSIGAGGLWVTSASGLNIARNGTAYLGLDAGNYNSYAPTLTGGGASGTWGINVTGASRSLSLPGQQTEYTILDGPANGPVIKVRYDGATANRYIDIGSKDGNGIYSEGLKIYNGGTPTFGGNTLLHAGNYSSYAMPSGSSATNSVDVRAPIFYDSNNTGYYVDPASTSRLNVLEVGTGVGGSNAGNLYIKGNNQWRWIAGYAPDYGVGNGFGLYNDTQGAYYTSVSTSGNWWFGSNNHGSSYRISINGTGYATGDFRAPILYDSSDTGYYIDPNSTNNAALRMRGGALFGPNTSWSEYLAVGGNGWWSGSYASVATTNGNLHIDAKTSSSTYLNLYAGSNVYFGNGAQSIVAQIASDGTFRSPIFYDYNNTGYYVDANSSSNLLSLNVAGTGVSLALTGANSRISFKDSENVWTGYVGFSGITGQLSFPGRNATINTGYNGTLTLETGASGYNSGQVLIPWGKLEVQSGDIRSPVYYDYNNTGYYLDPNSTSNISDLVVRAGTSVVNISDLTTGTAPIRVTNTGTGTGDVRYIPMISGTSTSSSGYLQHTVLGSVRGSVWGAAFIGVGGNDSYPTVAYTFHYGGYATAPESWRAPIFYDSNDTGFYADFNSTGVAVNAAGAVRGTYYVASNYLSTGYTQYKGYDNNNHFIVVRGGVGGNTSSPSITGQHQTTFVEYAEGNDGTGWFFKTSATGNYDIVSRITRSYSLFEGSARAPIFYDSNDTAYFVDPNSSGTCFKGYGTVDSRIGFISTSNPWGTSNSAYFPNGISTAGGTNWIYGQSYIGNAPSNGAGHEFQTNGSMRSTGAHRASIYYDDNDTTYYCDPATFTYLGNGIANSGGHGSSYIYNRLLAANNGAATGEVRLQMWCSEPGNSWDWAGFGYNVDHNNNTNPPAYYFGRPNTSFGQAYMRFSTSGNWYFYNTNTGGTRYETMVLTNSGNVEAISSSRAPIFYDLNNTGYYADLNSTGDSIRAAGNITAYYSDMRLKTHLGKIENAREKVRQLEGFYYEANELAQSFGYKPRREVGVSAQAVQAVLPEIVSDAPINSTYLTIDYERLTPLLIEAIKEQDQEVIDLRNRVAHLESLINKLIGD